jgi:mannose-6-phosphate isomerase-like protein (cupin superfamily)
MEETLYVLAGEGKMQLGEDVQPVTLGGRVIVSQARPTCPSNIQDRKRRTSSAFGGKALNDEF